MLLDSCSWIEVFEGSVKGELIMKIIEDKEIYTSAISISEIANWCRKNSLDEKFYIRVIEENSSLLFPTKDILAISGIINFERKKLVKNWGMIDSIIYATASTHSLKIITTDHHFIELDNVEIIE